MGNDGGSIPDRRDLVRSKPKAEQADKHNQLIARWFFCALSKRPLEEPIVSCALGKLYNKDALLEFLLDRAAYGDGDTIAGHIRSLKDVVTLRLTPNPATATGSDEDLATPRARFVCPLNLKEMSGGQPFVYVVPCGHVFSAAGLRAVAGTTAKDESELCPQCGAKYRPGADVRALNPPPEEEERLRAALPARGKKRKAGAADAAGDAPKRVKAAPASAPTMNSGVAVAARKAVAAAAAAPKSDLPPAIAALYANKDTPQPKETFLTKGTFTRYA